MYRNTIEIVKTYTTQVQDRTAVLEKKKRGLKRKREKVIIKIVTHCRL